MSRYDMLARARQLVSAAMARQNFTNVVCNRIWNAALHIRVKMRRIGCENDDTASGIHSHDLHSHRVAANMMDTKPWSDLFLTVMKDDTTGKQPANHRSNVFCIKRPAHERMRHMAACAELNLTVLHVVSGGREKVVIAAVVIVHMGDDDVSDTRGIDAERFQTLARIFQECATALSSHGFVETGIDDIHAVALFHRPNVIVERHRRLVVRITRHEILASGSFVMRVTQSVNFPETVGHKCGSLYHTRGCPTPIQMLCERPPGSLRPRLPPQEGEINVWDIGSLLFHLCVGWAMGEAGDRT